MNHTIMPDTAQGQPIPLIKLGQGRGDEHESGPLETAQTFAAKLRAAGYQEPSLKSIRCINCGEIEHTDGGIYRSHMTPDYTKEGKPVFYCKESSKPGHQEPVPPAKPDGVLPQNSGGVPKNDGRKGADSPLPVVSREGFRAGVLSAIAGGVIIACFYLAWGLVAACLFAAVCVGFVAGMLITQEWK